MAFTIEDTIAERYRLKKQLGQGSSALTFLAEDLEKADQVLLKVLPLQQLNDWKNFELFEREAAILANLKHPFIPGLQNFFRQETPEGIFCCLVMDYIPGQSLQSKLSAGWRPEEQQVRQLAEQILQILLYLHRLNPPVIHRDIKPANLILNPAQQLFLVDFGAVQAVSRSMGATIVGTYGYMAPEQFSGRAVPASDLYSLGATLLELMTGMAPHEMEAHETGIAFAEHYYGSQGFRIWLERLLAPQIAQRFGSAQQALSELWSLPDPPATPDPTGPETQLMQNPKALESARVNEEKSECVAATPEPPLRPLTTLQHKDNQLTVDFPPETNPGPFSVSFFAGLLVATHYSAWVLIQGLYLQQMIGVPVFIMACLGLVLGLIGCWVTWQSWIAYRVVFEKEDIYIEKRLGRRQLGRTQHFHVEQLESLAALGGSIMMVANYHTFFMGNKVSKKEKIWLLHEMRSFLGRKPQHDDYRHEVHPPDQERDQEPVQSETD